MPQPVHYHPAPSQSFELADLPLSPEHGERVRNIMSGAKLVGVSFDPLQGVIAAKALDALLGDQPKTFRAIATGGKALLELSGYSRPDRRKRNQPPEDEGLADLVSRVREQS